MATKKPVTVEHIVTKWRKIDTSRTRDIATIGGLIHRMIRRIVGKADTPAEAKAARAMTIHTLAERLADQGVCGGAARVNQFVAIYHVAVLFGADGRASASGLPVSVVRAFCPLIDRQPDESWVIQPDNAEEALRLWEQAASESLSASAVEDAVARMLPARPGREATSSSPFDKAARLVDTMDDLEQLEVLRDHVLARISDLLPAVAA